MSAKVRRDTRAFVKKEIDFGGAQSKDTVILVGAMPVYLEEDTDASNLATAHLIGCGLTADLDVTGADDVGNTAVAVGDALYKDGTQINKDAVNGTFIGYALGAVTSGATTEIEVALVA